MATSVGQGTGAAQQPVTVVINQLMNQRIRQSAIGQVALAAAPEMGVDSLTGEYPVETSWAGLDLSTGSDPTQAVNPNSTVFPDSYYKFESNSWKIDRFNITSFAMADEVAQSVRAATGMDINGYLAEKYGRVAAEVYAKQVMDLIGDDANWATGHKADSGNVTATTFDVVEDIAYDSLDALHKAGKLYTDDKLLVVVASDVMKELQKNQQLRARVGALQGVVSGETEGLALTRTLSRTQVEQALAQMFDHPNVECMTAWDYYVNASGTKTAFFSGKIAVLPVSGGTRPTFARTVTLAGSTSPFGELVSDRNVHLRGNEFSISAFYDVHLSDDQAGFLHYDLLS